MPASYDKAGCLRNPVGAVSRPRKDRRPDGPHPVGAGDASCEQFCDTCAVKRNYLIVLAALAAIALAAGLFSGADWLGAETWVFGIPLGNFAAWALLVAWCALPWLSASGSSLRGIALGVLIFAAAWLPVSIALFGNVNLSNASPTAYNIWLAYTGVLAVAPLLLLLALGLRCARKALRGNPQACSIDNK